MVYARLVKEKSELYQEKLHKVMQELPNVLETTKDPENIRARIDALEEKHGLDYARVVYENALRKFILKRKQEELAIQLSHMRVRELEELAKPYIKIMEKLGA